MHTSRSHCRCLFIVSVCYASIDCRSHKVKDRFYRDLSQLLQNFHTTDVVLIIRHFRAIVGCFGRTEWQIGYRFVVPIDQTDNSDRFIWVCSDYRMFLVNTNAELLAIWATYKRRISSNSVALINTRRYVALDTRYNEMHKSMRRQLTTSLRTDGEQCWDKEMQINDECSDHQQ